MTVPWLWLSGTRPPRELPELRADDHQQTTGSDRSTTHSVTTRKRLTLLKRNMTLLDGDLRRETFGLAGFPAVFSRVWLALCLAEQGKFDEAAAHSEEATAIAEAENHAFSLVVAHAGTGMLHILRG